MSPYCMKTGTDEKGTADRGLILLTAETEQRGHHTQTTVGECLQGTHAEDGRLFGLPGAILGLTQDIGFIFLRMYCLMRYFVQ